MSNTITLAIAPGCPHCATVMQILQELVKQGEVASIQIINMARDPQFAEQQQIRAVPWLKIGRFVVTGLQSRQDIMSWLEKSQSAEGERTYLVNSLTDGELDSVIQAIGRSPELIDHFIALIADEATNINVRIGIGAIIETLPQQTILQRLLTGLVELSQHPQPRVRSDAAHFLSFIHQSESVQTLESLLTDSDADVREIAAESLETLSEFVTTD